MILQIVLLLFPKIEDGIFIIDSFSHFNNSMVIENFESSSIARFFVVYNNYIFTALHLLIL